MKKLILFMMSIIAVLFSACDGKDGNGEEKFVPLESIALEQTNLIVAPGLKKYLNVIFTPENATNKAVIWSSSDPDFVEINETTGELSVKKITSKTVTVTVKTVEKGLTASCGLSVVDIPTIGVKVVRERVLVLSGLKETLKATVLPNAAANKNVTWESANNNVATITPSGVVTAVAPGIVKMTVTTVDGGFQASTYVYVVAKPLPLDNPNLLLSPNFQDGTDNANPSNWTKVLQAWFMSYYTQSPEAGLAASGASWGTGNVNRLPVTDAFFTGNGAYFKPTMDAAGATFTGRFQANVTGGFYQVVTVKPGGNYWVSIDIGYRNNDANSSIKPWETLKILSPDGGTTFYEVPIDIGPTKISGSGTNKILTAAGCFTVPPGVSQARYQIDIRSWAVPNNSPLTCFCNCQFREYTPLPNPE